MVADVYRLSRDTLAVREMRRRKPIKRVCLAPARYCAAQLAWKKPGAAEYGFVPRSLIGRPPPDTLAALQPKE